MSAAIALENPYLGIFVRPRTTIRRIVDANPRDRVIAIVVAAAVFGSASWFFGNSAAHSANTSGAHILNPRTSQIIRTVFLLLSPLFGITLLYIQGALLSWSGGLLGGAAKSIDVRAAIAWSRIPNIASYILYLPAVALGLVVPLQMGARPSLHELVRHFFELGGIFVVLGIWELVVFLSCIAEVHRFSIWRALGSWLIALLSIIGAIVAAGVVIVIIALSVMFLVGHLHTL